MHPNKVLKILITDDDFHNRQIFISQLEKLPLLFEIDEASDGKNAVEMVVIKISDTNANYDYIIMDYQMPMMNGQLATSTIRQIEQDKNLDESKRSIIITWSSSKTMPFDGADAIISKPLIPSEVLDIFSVK
ncbi:MAG: hypothetical protein ACD_46C00160G0005 [uncultured bacterium]|nr:MAG: hypothetical protein ACD_46C00160G0005 [uncultured bacterium]